MALPGEHPVLPRIVLVTGGARSGKSRFAETLVEQSGLERLYLATALAGEDPEMAERIRRHRERRGATWRTVEEPLELVAALEGACGDERAVLVDCLTLWLSNLMASERDVAAETARLADALTGLAGHVVFVTNEVGTGIVPANALARAFRDHAGRLNQAVAGVADSAVLMVSGLALTLKGKPLEV